MSYKKETQPELEGDYIFTPYVTDKRTGKRRYHPTGGVFKFPRNKKKPQQ